MKSYKITYSDNSFKTFNAIEHNGALCSQFLVADGFEFRKRRTNPDPFDDDEPEYETYKKAKYRTEYKPFLNRTALSTDGKMTELKKLVKKATRFSEYLPYSFYFLRVGENLSGINIQPV